MLRESKWFQPSLAIATMISYLIIALSIFQIPKEITSNGSVPLRIIILLIIALSVWVVGARVAEQPIIKSLGQYIVSTLAIASFILLLAGIKEILGHVFNVKTSLDIKSSISILIVSGLLLLLFSKLLKSRWLK